MRKLFLIFGSTALALSAPALAKGEKGGGPKDGAHQGGGHGGGGKKGGGPEQGGGKGFKGGSDDAGKSFKDDRFDTREAKSERRFEARADKDLKQAGKDFKRAGKSDAKAFKHAAKRGSNAYRRGDGRYGDDRDERLGYSDDRYDGRDGRFCPPGLAKKDNGCLPPGQAKKQFALGDRYWSDGYDRGGFGADYDGYLPDRYRAFYPDGGDYSYRYDDGDIFRIDRGSNLISGLIPLLGGAFGIGEILPAGYDLYNLPSQYRDDYADSGEDLYRYGDNGIYRVDAGSGVIESIVQLLAGDLNVGQALPAGYDAYNLPMEYRDDYADNADSLYRYNDGNIYQVDAKTQIIEAIVSALA